MLIEKQTDLFKEIELDKCCIVHCISADKIMGAGIAKPLQEKFHIRENWPFGILNLNWDNQGYAVITPADQNVLINLITKEKCWQKPTYTTLTQALIHSRAFFEHFSNLPRKIVMPRIGCGLDRLNWTKVKEIVKEIYADFDVVVCFL